MKRTLFILIISILFLFSSGAALLCAQSGITAEADAEPSLKVQAATETDKEFEPLPSGYGDLKLGLEIETVKEMLKKNPAFSYRGDPDVTMRPMENSQVIDCDGSFYIERGYFQFNDDKLYLITMVLDREYIDHYSVYTAFTEKYGDPVSLDPQKSVWRNEDVTISLERPLSIKYIDSAVFQKLQQESSSQDTAESMMRQNFLESF